MSLNSITTKEITNKMDEYVKLGKDTNVRRELKRRVDRKRLIERSILAETKLCPISNIKQYLGSLDRQALQKLVRTNFDDSKVMETVSCVTQSLGYDFYNYDSLDLSNRVNDWFNNPKKIDVESADGVVYQISLKDARNLMVLKAPKGQNSDLVHEIFVGLLGTNQARKDIPNFAYVFGSFNCSPIIDVNEPLLCRASEGVTYTHVLYENIKPAVPFKEIVNTMKVKDYLSILLQICFATEYAHRKFNWAHNDLHTNNVLLRPINLIYPGEEYRYIYYSIDNLKIYLKTKYIATIIDYGRSHIRYKDIEYGHGSLRGNTDPDVSFPIADIYRFFMTSASYLLNETKYLHLDLRDTVEEIFGFFNSYDKLKDAIRDQREHHYILPKTDLTKSLTITKFVHHIQRRLTDEVVKVIKMSAYLNPNIKILGHPDTETGTGTGTASSSYSSETYEDLETYEKIGIAPNKDTNIKSIKEYFSLSPGFDKTKVIEDINKSLLYPTMTLENLNIMKTQIANLNLMIGDAKTYHKFYFKLAFIQELGYNVFQPENYEIIEDMVKEVVKIKNLKREINTLYAAGVTACNDFNDQTTKKIYSGYYQVISVYEGIVNEMIESIYDIFNHFNNIIPDVRNELEAQIRAGDRNHADLTRILKSMDVYKAKLFNFVF